MSASHRRATAQNLAKFAQNIQICNCNRKVHDFCNSPMICIHFYPLYALVSVFLRKIFTTKVVTAQKLLECLSMHWLQCTHLENPLSDIQNKCNIMCFFCSFVIQKTQHFRPNYRRIQFQSLVVFITRV